MEVLEVNGDGHNDFLFIEGADSLSDCKVEIFNRWGHQVWSSNHYANTPSNSWYGHDEQGNSLPDETYYYIITIGEGSSSGWIELSH